MEFAQVQHLLGHANNALFGAVGTQVHGAQNIGLGAFVFTLVESALQKTSDFVERKFESRVQLMRFCGKRYAPVGSVEVNVCG